MVEEGRRKPPQATGILALYILELLPGRQRESDAVVTGMVLTVRMGGEFEERLLWRLGERYRG